MKNFFIEFRPEFQQQSIQRFEAIISAVDKSGIPVDAKTFPKYIRVPESGKPSLILKSNPKNAGNKTIFISNFWKEIVPSPTTYEASSKNAFFWFRLSHDPSQRLAFIGLLIAGTGVVIDGAFAIGKFCPLYNVSENGAALTLGFALILEIIGLGLAFKKGFWDT